ncbi:MAG TPA: hypothetical protein VMI06_02175, partial [Terriglobia bacterium]|nr:hypothetical protein [Terriglobia bacterium]
GTPGFYWGDNNAKDLSVRLEDYPDPQGDPAYIPYAPTARDLAWQGLYRKYRGRIDEQFGFLAFRTAPLVSASTMDGKVVTSDMARHLMVWAAFGEPNELERLPDHGSYAGNEGLYPSGYYLFEAQPSQALLASVRENEKTRLAESADPPKPKAPPQPAFSDDRLWKGWILPASDADTWFVAGSAKYKEALQSKDVEEALDAERATWRGLQLSPETPANHFRREQTRGVLFLDSLRRKMGDTPFLKLMRDYFAANTTRTVTAQSFLNKASAHLTAIDPPPGPAYLTRDIWSRLASAVIVYGTLRDAGANRYAAERLQRRFLNFYESEVPIYKDFEVTEDLLRHRDVVFVGRPEANSALAAWTGKLHLDYEGAAFKINGEVHASEREALILAAENPLDASHMALVVAGNDALSTVKTEGAELSADQYVIFRDGGSPAKGFIVQGSSDAQVAGSSGLSVQR